MEISTHNVKKLSLTRHTTQYETSVVYNGPGLIYKSQFNLLLPWLQNLLKM